MLEKSSKTAHRMPKSKSSAHSSIHSNCLYTVHSTGECDQECMHCLAAEDSQGDLIHAAHHGSAGLQ